MRTAGSTLKKERMRQNLTLREVTSATKINVSYLEAIEADEFEKFPSSVYAKGFLQNYSKFLGLPADRIIALYRRSVGAPPSQPAFVPQGKKSTPRLVVTPGLVVISVIAVIVVTTLAYLIYQFYNFQKPPLLQITYPDRNITTEDSDIVLSGITEPGMFVTINDEPIKILQNGAFEATLVLSSGTNTIIVKARHPDNIGKEAVVTRTIEYAPPIADQTDNTDSSNTPTPPETQTLTEMNLVIDIGVENAWLEVQVDGDQSFASVAPAGSSYTYTAEREIFVRTGKVTSTTITVNDEPVELYIEAGGVASVTCEFDNDTIDCHQ